MNEFTAEKPHTKLLALKKALHALGFKCEFWPVNFADGTQGHSIHVLAPKSNTTPNMKSQLLEDTSMFSISVLLDGTVKDYDDNGLSILFNEDLSPKSLSQATIIEGIPHIQSVILDRLVTALVPEFAWVSIQANELISKFACCKDPIKVRKIINSLINNVFTSSTCESASEWGFNDTCVRDSMCEDIDNKFEYVKEVIEKYAE